ncbi:diguanylate cyclase [Paraglaciecola sp. 2405UD69-4]|uniref:sensor domain-containing diguanylate cyclase n=1 Tax=Paraglaciecola sp. 2405UD69-4 TaxID=3391836 RepID=UPI0039C9A885
MITLRLEGQKLPSKVLSVILFLITLVIFIALTLHFGVALKPSHLLAKEGEITLHNHYFTNETSITLGGKWTFYEGRLLEPKDIPLQLQAPTLIEGSGGWSLHEVKGNTAIGYGTYFLKLTVPNSDLDLAIKIPRVQSAYKLFINDKLMASGGVVATHIDEGKPGFYPTIVNLPKGSEHLTITIQVSNFHASWGGLWAPIVIGDVERLYAEQRDLVALSMFIIGALVVTTAFYLIQYYFRPSEKISLAFVCLCLMFLVREFTAQHMHFTLQHFSIDYALALKLNYLTFYLGVINVLYFMHLCFPNIFSQTISRLFYVIGIGFSLFVIVSPTRFVDYSLTGYQVFCLIVILYIMTNMVKANIAKQPTAKMMAFSCFILATFAINDMLYTNGVIDTGNFFSIGIVGFIICQSYIIIRRFSNILTSNETLSKELQQSNSELKALGAELEQKVQLRTKELELANIELNKLARFDKLTGLLNRYGVQDYLEQAFDNVQRSSESSCVILYDFDNFKYINDSYGHDLGDLVLVMGSKTIKNQIRKQDKLARWGGEEFLVLLPKTDLAGALQIAEKLRLAIEHMKVNEGGTDVPVTITGGVAELRKEDTFESLFKRADNALYKGKHLGRNCIQS